ncbi:MAG: glutamyl-tRNA reductase [Flavobacteriales bacterium AspAUS03]
MKNFYLVSLDYKAANASTRGQYSLTTDKVEDIKAYAQDKRIDHFFALSTCNRTEFYAFASSAEKIITLFYQCTQGNVEELRRIVRIKKEQAAVEFLFRVGTGLESQILGDFEIIGQIKKWFSLFKKLGTTNAFLERLINSVAQASKRIKSETRLSSGVTSVSYAAVRYILGEIITTSKRKILLFGTGKIGRNTCENLVKHTKNSDITLINRTKEKAQHLASKYHVKNQTNLQKALDDTDILIVATSADKPIIIPAMLSDRKKELLIIDLSIPENVERSIGESPHICLLNVDELSKRVDDTLEQRKKELPKAELIIQEVKGEFSEWAHTRQYAPTIQAFKERLVRIYEYEKAQYQQKNPERQEEESPIVSKMIQKITNHFAQYLSTHSKEANKGVELIGKIFHLNA